MSSDSEDCTAVGKLFHTRAAVELNARPPMVTCEERRAWLTTTSIDAAGNQHCSPVGAGRKGNAGPCGAVSCIECAHFLCLLFQSAAARPCSLAREREIRICLS